MSWSVGTPVVVDPPWSAGGGLALGTATPAELDTAAAGASTFAAHEDHIHPTTIGGVQIALVSDSRFTDQRVPTDGSVTNAKVASGAAIAYSKLNLAGSVTNADLAGSIAYSKLVLTGSVVNADIAAAAAIAYSKLNLATSVKDTDMANTTANFVLRGGAGGVVAWGTLFDGSIASNANIAVSKLAKGSANQILVTDSGATTVQWANGIAATAVTGTAFTLGGGDQTMTAKGSLLVKNQTAITDLILAGRLSTDTAGSGNNRFTLTADGTMSWGTGGASAVDTILQRNAVGFVGGSSCGFQASNGSNTSPSISFAADQNTGFYSPTQTDTIGIAIGGTLKALIDSNGGYALQVAGAFQALNQASSAWQSFRTKITGDSTPRLDIMADGSLKFSDGTTQDTTLARTGSGVMSIGSNAILTVAGGTLNDAANIAVGSTTGTKIGTATSQKLGFFNSTPVVQPSPGASASLATILTGLKNLGLLSSTTTGAIVNSDVASAAGITMDKLATGTFPDANNIGLGTTTGTKIGTATSQKLGFFNATPVTQRSGPGTLQSVITALSDLGLTATGTAALVNSDVSATAAIDVTKLSGVPRGTMGAAQVTSSPAAVGGTITDVTGLSVTFTAVSGRRYRVSAYGRMTATNADGWTVLYIREGSTTLVYSLFYALLDQAHTPWTYVTPSAGSHTYKVSIQKLSGTGTATLDCAADHPAQLLVEDIGT